MVKAIAALLMLIDHIGAILFPKILILRLIGRFSMPLFAFSIARGFYYSRKKNIKNFNKYAKNLLLLASGCIKTGAISGVILWVFWLRLYGGQGLPEYPDV